MTTAADIIEDALTEIGVLGAGQTPAAEDSALCLRRLNHIVQQWSNSPLAVPYLTTITVPLTGAASYTIGPSGAVVAARPIRIDAANARDTSSVDFPVTILDRVSFGDIPLKQNSGGPPEYVWYDKTATNGTLYVYPKAPSTYTLYLDCLCLLTTFDDVADVVNLPEGYETALYLELADNVAGAFGRQMSQDARRRHAGAKRLIKRSNVEPMVLDVDFGGQTFQYSRGY